MKTTCQQLSRGEQLLLDLIRAERGLATIGDLRAELHATQAAFDHCLISLVRFGLVALQEWGGGGPGISLPAGSLEWNGRTYHAASAR